MDEDGNISVEFDCPDSTSDESIGAIAMEMFVRIAKVLNEAYMELAKALYFEETSTDMKAIVENANLESLLKDPDSEIRIRLRKDQSPEDTVEWI